MKRSIQGQQRGMRVLSFKVNAAGTSVTGMDAALVSCTDTGTGVKTIELGGNGFASSDYSVQVTLNGATGTHYVAITDANTFVISTFAVDGSTATDKAVEVLVIGSDVSDRV